MARRKRSRMKYSEESMQAACKAFVEEKTSLKGAAELHGVPVSTLKGRVNGIKPFHDIERTVLTSKEEERLVHWITESANRGFGRTLTYIQQAVQTMLNQRRAVTIFKDNLPGRKWVTLFLRRHKNVIHRTPQALEAQRAAVIMDELRVWFETALQEIKASGGDVLNHPSRIFNCDETGFRFNGSGLSKVLTKKGVKSVYQVTVLACGSASGEVHDPLIIFPGETFSYDPLEGFPEAHFAKSSNGCIDGEIFSAWLKTAFIPATEHLPKPVLLFADRHKAHLSLTVSELCRDHSIILYQLPSTSNSNHIIQPLDFTNFKLLKQVWREELLKYQEENCDIVGKREFSFVLKKAWERGIQKDDVISGFRAAGLYPWNPDKVDMTNVGPSSSYSPKILVTATNSVTMDDEQNLEDLPSNPPSPTSATTFPSALPPLSLSMPPVPSCINISTSSSSSSSSQTTTSYPSAKPLVSLPSSFSSSWVENASITEALDRLLDLGVRLGHEGLVHCRTLINLGLETVDPDERFFCMLYSKLTWPPTVTDDNSRQTFENLPLPSSSTQSGKRLSLDPPKMLSSNKYRQYKTDMEAKKRKIEEDKESQKKEVKEKKIKTEEKTRTGKEKEGERRKERSQKKIFA